MSVVQSAKPEMRKEKSVLQALSFLTPIESELVSTYRSDRDRPYQKRQPPFLSLHEPSGIGYSEGKQIEDVHYYDPEWWP